MDQRKVPVTQCLCCLQRRKCDDRGWCSTCKRAHTCFHCKRTTATVRGPGGMCSSCRDGLDAVRAASARVSCSLPRLLEHLHSDPRRGR